MTRADLVAEGERYLKAHKDGRLKSKSDLIRALGNKWYRLNALYKIKNKKGKVVRFRPNLAQRERFINRHYWDLILKARQLGFTTFEMIDALDDCLWTDNFAAGCIAHTLGDAKDIFSNKVKFAYDQLRLDQAWNHIFTLIDLKLAKPKNDKGEALVFDNGSSIKVSTSYRGGTLQRLHVSEFGKICRKYPDKAREIVTGAFEAVGIGNQITLESTAEGREGYFFDYTQASRKLLDAGKAPTEMDFQFHFYPWHQEPGYRMNPEGVDIPSYLMTYFLELQSKHGITTDAEQQAWYAKKVETLGDDIRREYPSTPDEAFEQAVQGAYLATQMRRVRKQGRITKTCKWNPELAVHTAWDLGMDDAMTIVFFQVVGREVHVIDYLEHSGEGLEYYAGRLREKGYTYGRHYGPHDLAVRELSAGGKTRLEKAAEYGLRFEDPIPRIANHAEGIEASRQFIGCCWFAETEQAEDGEANNNVDRLIDCLDNYRKEWDERLGVYKSTPRHDWASHGYKAFETLARAPVFESMTSTAAPPAKPNTDRGRKAWGAYT